MKVFSVGIRNPRTRNYFFFGNLASEVGSLREYVKTQHPSQSHLLLLLFGSPWSLAPGLLALHVPFASGL